MDTGALVNTNSSSSYTIFRSLAVASWTTPSRPKPEKPGILEPNLYKGYTVSVKQTGRNVQFMQNIPVIIESNMQ